jgi:protein TonB
MRTMRFAGFQGSADRGRRRRFVLTFGLSGLLYVAIGAAVVLLARGATMRREEPEIDVTFRPPPAASAAQAARAPAPPPPPARRSVRPAGASSGRGRGLVAPSAISDRTDEANPGAPLAEVPEESGGSAAPAPAPKPAPPVRPAPPPPPPPPPLPEPDEPETPPVPAAGNAVPEYPAAARSKGLEGVVILKLQISETGQITKLEVLRGGEPFLAAALAAVRTWHYSPALRGGRPVSTTRLVKIPFRIRSS